MIAQANIYATIELHGKTEKQSHTHVPAVDGLQSAVCCGLVNSITIPNKGVLTNFAIEKQLYVDPDTGPQ